MADSKEAKGLRLNDYTLVSRIGQGAFSSVSKAVKKPDETFTVKRIRSKLGQSNTKQFLSAACKLSKHENVIRFHEYFVNSDKNIYYIVLDYTGEGNLNDYMIENDTDSDDQFKFMLNIAKGLNFLHSKGVIHGDLRPQNILIKMGKSGPICAITDYNLYKIQGPFTLHIDSQDIASWYQAPEVAGNSEYSKESDVFSLGAVFHVLTDESKIKVDDILYLVPIFHDESRRNKYCKVVDASKTGEIESYLGDSFSKIKILGDLIVAMLEADPDKRPKVTAAMVKVAEAKGAFFSKEDSKKKRFVPGHEMLFSFSDLGSSTTFDSSTWSFDDDVDSSGIVASKASY